MRLRRSNPQRPGLTRHRRGRGWTYRDADGKTVQDGDTRRRIDALAIPPAWTEVWICPWENGHLQAIGTDAAGRRQYLYHQGWSDNRRLLKFDRMQSFARRLPAARQVVDEQLGSRELTEERVAATAFLLLDRGHFRIGGEVYAELNGSIGLATLERSHITRSKGGLVFEYPAKSGQHRVERLEDPVVLAALDPLLRRRSGPDELLAFRRAGQWHRLTGADINAHLKVLLADDFSAKDFRTWHGTTSMAVALADPAVPAAADLSPTKLRRVVREAIVRVADRLGNTPAVCRSAYVDPRVIEAYEQGRTISRATARVRREDGVDPWESAPSSTIERAVLALLRAG